MTIHASTLFCRTSLLLLSPLVLMTLSGCATGRGDASPPSPDSIKGRYIAVMCDADMTWSAFSSGALGDHGNAADSLTVVSLPIAPGDTQSPRWQTRVAQAPVSNSAMGPPGSISVSADGTRGFVCETRGPAPAGATQVSQLPMGTALTAVDLADPSKPSVLGRIEVGDEPSGCDVSPDGTMVAVVTRKPGAQLVMVPTSGATPLGQPVAFPLVGAESGRPSCVQWHPKGRYLAVTLPDTNQVAFYEFTPDQNNGGIGIAPWGKPVTVGKYPASGRFTPDGKYFITTDLQWGPDVEGFMAGAPEGQLSVIKLSDLDTNPSPEGVDDSGVEHVVVSHATVGVSPECMALSPDGRYVVTGNLKGSFIAEGAAHATPGGSLSLLGFNDGQLTPISETPIRAMPEGIAFDAAGAHLVVSEFRTFDPGALDGELAFYKLVTAGTPKLVPAKFYVGVGRGPHGVVIVR